VAFKKNLVLGAASDLRAVRSVIKIVRNDLVVSETSITLKRSFMKNHILPGVYKPKHLGIFTALLGVVVCSVILSAPDATAQTDVALQRAFQQDRDIALQNPDAELIPGSLIIKFSDVASRAQGDAILSAVGAARIKDFSLVPGLTHISVPAAAMDRIIAALQNNPLVDYVEPDYVVSGGQTIQPNDTHFGLQWALLNSGQTINRKSGLAGADIRATQAWSISTGGAGCLVAVIDSGVQLNHPDLSGNIWRNPLELADGFDSDENGFIDDVYGWDFVDNDNNPADENGHGTHVAGTIAAVSNNGTGIAGVAWNCKIMALRFLNANGSGTTSAAISALEYAVFNGARISNNSWGGGGYSSALRNTIEIAGKQYGHLFIAAAGNSGADSDRQPSYPAAYDLPNIISVAATDNRDRLANFSNYGVTSVDLGAPGVDIASTYINDRYVYMSGTSMAAPHVAGVAGLIAERYPHVSFEDLALILLGSARPLPSLEGKTTTGGMLDALSSLQNADAILESTSETAPEESAPDPDPEVIIPSAASGLSVVNNRNSTATLNWKDNSDNESGFLVERQKLNGGGRWSASTEIDLPADTVTYTDSSGAGTYQYRVRAYNSAGSSSATDWVRVEVTRR